MEAWFSYAGGGNINSIIDYAGTEKLVREVAGEGAGYRNNSAAPLYPLGSAEVGEWHYTAVVFTPTAPVAAGSITGDFTFYFDGNVATETIEAVTISDFGDSLNRTIAVGAHPLGFAGDFLTGLIFEPRVSLGALGPEELLFGQSPFLEITITELERLEGANRLVWTSRPGRTYSLEYSLDLQDWKEIDDPISTDADTTEFTHTFVPEFEEVADAPMVFYRAIENTD